MLKPWRFFLGAAILPLISALLRGDEVRYYQAGGVTYCETSRTVQRLVPETKMQLANRTTYKEEFYSQTRDMTRTTWCPTTTYRADTYWVNRWNPFMEPYKETRWIPETRCVPRSEVVKMPVTCRRLIPQTVQVQVPVSTQRVVTEKVVVSRVPVAGPLVRSVPCYVAAPPVFTPRPATSGERIGGIARLDNDPPRQGSGTGWQASSPR